VQSLPTSKPDSPAHDPDVSTAETINLASACAELLEDSGSLPTKVSRWIEDWTTERDGLPDALSAMHQRQLTEAESKLAVKSLLRVAAQRSGINLPASAVA